MVYLISYDLNKIKDYPRMYEAIKKLGDYIHPLDSLFFVSTSLSQAQLNKVINDAIDKDDTYLVAWITSPPSGRLEQKYWDWINAKLQAKPLSAL